MKKKDVIEAEIVEEKEDTQVVEEKPYFFPRFVAYIIDILLLALASTLILMVIPRDKNYDKYVKEYETIQTDYLEKKISMDEYMNKSKDVVYNIDYAGAPSILVQVTLYIGYFIVLQYFNKGQTIGKKIMKVKVISTKDGELSLNQIAIRALIINSIATNILVLAALLFIGKEAIQGGHVQRLSETAGTGDQGHHISALPPFADQVSFVHIKSMVHPQAFKILDPGSNHPFHQSSPFHSCCVAICKNTKIIAESGKRSHQFFPFSP